MPRWQMLVNEEIVEEFKKSLTATVKSIGRSEKIEVNFVQEKTSIAGSTINLVEPTIKSLKNGLDYIRAEADSMALEIRFHEKKIHEKFLTDNSIANEIFNAVEQSRIEARGSEIFKGICIPNKLFSSFLQETKIPSLVLTALSK